MKQYTNKDQTAKLLELGFPRPKPSFYQNGATWIQCDGNYSIGELIEFLEHRIYRIKNDMQWFIDGGRVYRADKELINALFEACVTLKEEGVI